MGNPVSEKEQQILIERMVLTATELGVNVVQTMAAETLKQKPGITLRDFTHILDQYIERSSATIKEGKSITSSN